MLLLAAAAAMAWSTYLHWLSCQGLLESTAFDPDRTESVFSDACLRRMDSGLPFPSAPEAAERAPGASELAAAAMALAGLAWLPLLLGLGWKRRTQSAAAIPAVVSLLLAARCWVSARTVASSPEGDTFFWLLLSIELAALIAAVMVWHQEEN
jgi:hypothetical protein